MGIINTTFAHGNGPYSRCVEWAIEVNNVFEKRGKKRMEIIVPLIYPGRQEKIMKEEICSNVSKDFFEKYPDEIILDKIQGKLLKKLMFKGNDYSENLKDLVKEYTLVEKQVQEHLNGKRSLENFTGEEIQIDLRDIEFQLGLNNRIQTGISNQFYTAGGAGPFDEILQRAILDSEIILDKDSMKNALPIAKRMIENQRIIFSNDPGVFSYDSSRKKRDNEIFTPCFIHFPKPDNTSLSGKGIYLLMTGIDGVRESGMYDAITELGMQIYAPKFSICNLPEFIKEKTIPLNPNQINNPEIVAQYAREGWSTIWLSHMAQKGFISPPYLKTDDPEMLFNERGIVKLSLGVVIENNPRKSLEKAIELSKNVKEYNSKLISNYGTLDGIKYSSEIVVDFLEKRDISKYKKINPIIK